MPPLRSDTTFLVLLVAILLAAPAGAFDPDHQYGFDDVWFVHWCHRPRLAEYFVYHMLKDHQPYHDAGASYYQERFQERRIRKLQRQAKELGLCLLPDPELAVS